MSEELKPCQFCGGAPTTTGPLEIGTSDTYETCIECERCGFQISSNDGFSAGKESSRAKAVERWNRRAIPAGYALVPVDPTEEMLYATRGVAVVCGDSADYMGREEAAEAYKAMLAAVPAPTQQKREPLSDTWILQRAGKPFF